MSTTNARDDMNKGTMMAKGKEALASARRREREALEALEAERAAHRSTKDQVIELQRQTRAMEGMQATIDHLEKENEERTSPEVRRLHDQVARLTEKVETLEVNGTNFLKIWYWMRDHFIVEHDYTQVEAVERLMAIAGIDAGYVLEGHQTKLPPETVRQLQKKQGLRRRKDG